MMLFLFTLIICAAYTLSEENACAKVTGSECNPATNTGLHLSSKSDCMDFCDLYASTGKGCIFAAWYKAPLEEQNCRMYDMSFSDYLNGCKLLGGPPNLAGCDVGHPEDNTCDAVREGNCFYHGDLIESVDNMNSWESCEAYCSLSPECEAWTFRSEPSLECQLLDSDARTCDISYTPSGVDPVEDCGQAGTGLLIVGGFGHNTKVDLWTPETSCSLPSLKEAMSTPTVNIIDGIPVACYKTNCLQLQGLAGGGADWIPYHSTPLHSRVYFTSAMLNDGLLLIGGKYSPSTTELLPWGDGDSKEGFTLYPSRENHCSIQVDPSTIIISGGHDTFSIVTAYSNLGSDVTTRQLPDHITGRWGHACQWYLMGDSQVLIVTGGRRQDEEMLASTEILDYSARAGGWREAGPLPAANRGLRGTKLKDIVYVVAGDVSDRTGFVGDILSWSPDTESWTRAGNLAAARSYPGVTEVSLAAVEGYCTSVFN